MSGDDYAKDVNTHYTEGDLESTVLGVLESWGKSDALLTPSDLAPIDQFHVGGLEATRALAERAGITAGTRILDVGGGLGGPARTLAASYGCSVTVLDLTEAFVSVGAMLTARSGLSDLVSFDVGDALDLPYPDGSYDLVWTQHSSMNIGDKPKLYAEIARVTKPGGRLALHEIMSDSDQSLIFPVPWARDASISFLWTPARIRSLLACLGYREIAWDDLTDPGVVPQNPPSENGGPTPGLKIIAGEDFPERAANLRKNFAEHRVRLVRAVLELD
jgi:SAM-dependent methyltransferase